MRQGRESKKIVFCLAERQNSHGIAQGFIKLIFEETEGGLTSVNQGVPSCNEIRGIELKIDE